ncbi:ABC transporter ATP-binding protein [Faecalibacterium sp. I3-3-89]|uniref:ABC transporter ATP-binding protein n=1 Tax=Faecalibacterium sp. I3-3-89 TaxID=2929493 RepID=UPI002014849F|nr:ABC transporter ATP-binding protein [Faecalibacterium sp. I3-3-89]UQK42059.1 ABC transporter ATP-binding protein/permease [Faecalibacterium sp. I3-3-89]
MKQRNTLQWLSIVTGKAKLLVGVLVAVQAVLSVSSIAFAFVLRRIINMAVDGVQGGFWASLALLVGILLGQIVLSAASRFLSEYTSAAVENRFKHRLFAALLTGNYASVTAVHSGEWMNRLTSDTTIIAGGVTQIVPGLIGMLVRLFGALAAILWLEPRFFWVLVPGGVAMLALTYGFRKILKRLHKNIQEADGTLRVFLQERLESLLIVRTFAKEQQTAAQAASLMEQHKAARMKRSNFSNLCNIGFAGAMNGAYLLGIGFCGYGILTGTMSYGNLMAIMQLVGQVQSPFANITGYLPRYYAMLASAERLMEAEAFAPDSEHPLAEEKVLEFYRTKLTALRLEHASFTYQPPVRAEEEQPPMPVVLKDIDLTIRKGEYIAFTGPSGCGKSTVLKLLMCLYPLDAGSRTLETISGTQPLTAAWRSLFAYVPQGNQLLSGTIRDIVSFGDPCKAQDDAGILRALRIACAEDFVQKLEKGLDTMLGEHGQGLSEGQMQRIAIARAVFSEHPILMLDEATSALDEATAQQLLENLRRMTDKTVLMVTHRADQTEFFDRELSFSKDGIRQKSKIG